MVTSLRFVHLDTPDSLLPAFNVMRQLRPHLTDARSFAAQVATQQAEGYRLLCASGADRVVGLAGYRKLTNLLYGSFVYVDDLVVDSTLQRDGVGTQLLDAVRQIAREAGCSQFVLDTGLHMPLAQRFYFRSGLLARGMHFVEQIAPVQIPVS
ncbi:GCN5 family acetyltransferase [Paraburkholderia ginsengiterrae]|uniref:GCN5 family acetyltransferase n=1 Tax=Paraburkholderia ginsengiterrae TaxID=1462993 RepID=A0A1A9NGG6_9BURK|nr:GNAT family N-acetyltransferase [Paraburkholderia ginsengiterrae]OAJ61741.1 GCN5 family acetyltransferase [Paraburkholderia ginsengiterrae]OAJ65339.1 GCN5 family acetyltransferase [Paraburkholderia ginsengiterrae]